MSLFLSINTVDLLVRFVSDMTCDVSNALLTCCVRGICLQILELLAESERLHEQALSREHEMKAVVSALDSFTSRAESVSVKLVALKADVEQQVMRPLSTDVDAIKTDLNLIKVLLFIYIFAYYANIMQLKTSCSTKI